MLPFSSKILYHLWRALFLLIVNSFKYIRFTTTFFLFCAFNWITLLLISSAMCQLTNCTNIGLLPHWCWWSLFRSSFSTLWWALLIIESINSLVYDKSSFAVVKFDSMWQVYSHVSFGSSLMFLKTNVDLMDLFLRSSSSNHSSFKLSLNFLNLIRCLWVYFFVVISDFFFHFCVIFFYLNNSRFVFCCNL